MIISLTEIHVSVPGLPKTTGISHHSQKYLKSQVSLGFCFPRAGILFWTQGSRGNHVTHPKSSPSLECAFPVCIELKNSTIESSTRTESWVFFLLCLPAQTVCHFAIHLQPLLRRIFASATSTSARVRTDSTPLIAIEISFSNLEPFLSVTFRY